MPKILAQTGISLSDIYNIQGSIVGVEQLLAKEVQTVHEMGGTIFSERVGAQLFRSTTGDLAQSNTWDVEVTTIQPNVTRILGVQVFTDNGARVDRATVSVRDPLLGREIPIFAFDASLSPKSVAVRVDENGTITNLVALNSLFPPLPSMLFGTNQPNPVGEIAFRGLATGFGAGTVEVIMILYMATAEQQGISSFGLPVPGW